MKMVDCAACGEFTRTAIGAMCKNAPGTILRTGSARVNGEEVSFVVYSFPAHQCIKECSPALTQDFIDNHKCVWRKPWLAERTPSDTLASDWRDCSKAVIFDNEEFQEVWYPFSSEEKMMWEHRVTVANYTGNYYHG